MKAIRLILLFLCTLVIWFAVNQYFFCPSYNFPAPAPFKGSQLYNPYAYMDSGCWHKCNFHAHSNAWKGLTNGDDSASTIWKKYDLLGYSVHCVSEYQQINESFHNSINYIPAYEHGFNLRKTHQLVLGDDHISWLDYFFPQTLSNKQRVLNVLKQNDSNIVVLNHPQLKKGYSPDELRYLTNYQCMEVLNASVASFPQWDAALSAGKAVFIVGDDDTHHINDINCIGRECTWINLKVINRRNVLAALRYGQGYGMHIASLKGESPMNRIKRIKYQLPVLKSFILRDDTIFVKMNQPAERILFSGQDGKILSAFSGTSSAYYVIKKDDPYVRSSFLFRDGTAIFLNPVFRHSGDPFLMKGAVVNHGRTVLLFLLGLNILLLWAVLLLMMIFGTYWLKYNPGPYMAELNQGLRPALRIV